MEFDRKKALEAAIHELRTNTDGYLQEKDLGSAIRRLAGKIGVNMSDAQINALCGMVGASPSLKPKDSEALRSVLGRAAKHAPKGTSQDELQDVVRKLTGK